MAAPTADRTLIRRRHHARLDFLKRRVTVASVLGFAAVFGLAAQHGVGASSGGKRGHSRSARSSASVSAPTTFFDGQSDGFSFDKEGAGLSQSGFPQSDSSSVPPVAQTSVS
jgi:hypothetical protein